MFSIDSTTLGEFSALRLSGPKCELCIIPSLGAMVHQVALGGRALLRCDEAHELEKNPYYRGRMLFPWNDRIAGGRYSFRGTEYRLNVNQADGTAIHGYVNDRAARLVKSGASDDEAIAAFSCGLSGEPGYPFSVRLDLEFRLREDSLAITFAFSNIGREAAPVALGWHPYFDLGCKADEIELSHQGAGFLPVDESLFPTGSIRPVEGTYWDFRRGKKIGRKDVDTSLTASPDGRTILRGPGKAIEIISDTALFPYTHFFIPPERDSLAVEPVSSTTDAFNRDPDGILVLESGESRSGMVGVRLL